MEFFKQNTDVDFMQLRYITGLVSVVLFLASIGLMVSKGLNWGLDFTGGFQIEVSFEQPPDIEHIREQVQSLGYGTAVVQRFGNSSDILISLAPETEVDQQKVVSGVLAKLPQAEKRRVDYVGPQVGEELMTKGFLAMLIAVIGTMIYIAFRFESRLAISSMVALIHDPLLILGLFAYYQWEFDLKVLAAILAVIGYSLNDTIVVFDRVRENFRQVRGRSSYQIVNLSINQTLSRTIMTSLLTLFVVVALLIYGGESIRGFSLALCIGIVVGTYSSIYIAGTSAVALGLDRQDFIREKTVEDDRP